MSPLLSRRRGRRRSVFGRLWLSIALLAILALLIGGLFEVGHESSGYHVDTDRSLAAQVEVAANESTTTAGQFRQMLTGMARQTRVGLEAQLDSLAQQASAELSIVERAATSARGSISDQLVEVFSARQQAVDQVRGAIDGLLSMHPLAVVGSPSADAAIPTPGLLTSEQAINRIMAVGSLLTRADADYRAARRSLTRAPGHDHLPASVWVTHSRQWDLVTVASEVDRDASSTTLVATHRLLIQSVQISPPALPTPNGVAGTSTLSPTSTVQVTVVLTDLGSADEPDATLQVSLSEAGHPAVTRTQRTSIDSGRSATLPTITFSVKAGSVYQLNAAIVLPPGQTATAGTVQTQVLKISPGT
ncbi:MAG TPA: hypothetical protein VGG38_06350 [Acidimicrobiales bacterium]|jgi:hypothetical protein